MDQVVTGPDGSFSVGTAQSRRETQVGEKAQNVTHRQRENARVKTLAQRIEDAIREDVTVVPYNPEWPKMFACEAELLRHKFPAGLISRIEHFGSTAIPGLLSKPIIDMLVGVQSLEATKKEIVPVLETDGYDYFWRTDVDPPYAWFIKRDDEGRRTHHIHMVETDSQLWERLYFRDYLKDFPDEARYYAQLKQLLCEKHPHDRVAYTRGKTEFVLSVTERAKQYYTMRS